MTVRRLRVTRVIAETDDARSLEFAVPAALADAFGYRPGQFLTVRVPSEQTGSVARCYSLCSAPHEGGPLRVTVKRTKAGYASNWLCDNAVAGTEIDVLTPAGVFTPKSLDTDLLLFAGGSGITPVMSILKSVLALGTGRVTLIYANRDEKTVIFADELAELSGRHSTRFTVLHWLETVQGLPNVNQLAALAAPWRDREAFICGPGPFMDAAAEALERLGGDRRRIHIERFKSLARNPFEMERETGAETGTSLALADAEDLPTSASASPVALTVDLDGDRRRFDWPRQQKLLDFMLDEGLDAPYSCREGACSACACRLVRGEVKLLRNEVLDPEDLDDGIILACQAIPITDDVSISYE